LVAQIASKISVLVVADDSENRDFLVKELEEAGILVFSAEGPGEAIGILETARVHALMIDMALSRQQRADFMKAVRTERCSNPLVILLAGTSAITREEAYDLGVSALFRKPIDFTQVTARLRELLVPEATRWSAARPAGSGRRRTVQVSLKNLKLGRAGFALPLESDESVLEGDPVEFSVEVGGSDRWTLKGTGVVRYVKLDDVSKRQKAWGIEFETLEETSLSQVMARREDGPSVPFIPRSLH
jgi:DNA-binding response OmpR family regulator